MALSTCNVTTDNSQKELSSHGIAMFPIACYDDDLNSMCVPWHWHDEFEFIIITEGVAHIQIENQTLYLGCGDALFINSAILHCIDCVKTAPFRCHSLVFHARLIGGSVESIFWHKLIAPVIQDNCFRYLHLVHSVSWQNDIIRNMATAWQMVVDESEDFENETRFYLSKAFRMMNSHMQLINRPIDKQEQLNANRTKIMIRYIEDNYFNDITLDMIADSVSISKSSCLRCFRQIINSTPIQYLMQYRIEKASDALKSTNEKVNRIAINCGFSDISYFSKCFRELKGITPIEYRKSYK